MEQSNKPKRPYNSTRRRAQADQTRQQIVEAARKLFPVYGFAGTTMEAIAQEAGVAAETVFAIFGSKRAILVQLVNVAVGGDEQPIPLLQRPGPQGVLQETDPVLQIQRFARDITQIIERVAPVFQVLRAAARTEPDIADLLKTILDRRLQNLAVFVHHLAAHAPLRAGLDEPQAADMVWTLTSPEVFSLLTTDRGWSEDQYSSWLGSSLVRLLLS